MRICYLTTTQNPHNGWGRYSKELIASAKNCAIEPLVICNDASAQGASIGAAPSDTFLGALFSAIRILPKVLSCELIHCLTEPYIPLAYFLSILSRKPLVITAVGTYSVKPIDEGKGQLYIRAFQRAAQVIAISRYTACELKKRVLLEAKRLKVIPLGLGEEYLGVNRVPLNKREKYCLAVGHVKPRKGILQAIDAFKQVAVQNTEYKFLIVGPCLDTAYLAQIKQEIERLGLSEQVLITGEVSDRDLTTLLRNARVLLMPSQSIGSYFEGFGLVHLEAQAFGTPSIGSRNCGNEDVIEDGETGFLIKQQDSIACATALRELLFDDQLWERMSIKAHQKAQNYSWPKIAQAYLEIYETIFTSNNAIQADYKKGNLPLS